MLENNRMTFGVNAISGKCPHGYTDSYSPVYTEYLIATLNGKENKLTKYSKTKNPLII